MIPSKDISDYIELGFSDIRAGAVLPFHLYLYLRANQHIIVLLKAGDEPGDAFFSKYQGKLKSVWIHKTDEASLKSYLAEGVEPALTPPPPPKTREGALIAKTLQSDLPEAEKKAIVAAAAQTILEEVAKPETLSEQARVDVRAQQTVQDILNAVANQTESLIADLWKMVQIDPELGHGVNVATYSVIYAMAFGRIEPDLLQDLAMAGLLHDLGLSQIPSTITRMPSSTLDAESQGLLSQHVDLGIELIEAYAPGEISERVKVILRQHHEKFDGSGYPNHLSGFTVDDISQLLAMADLTDSIACGQWDGQKRTLKGAFDVIRVHEKNRSFPEYFNPEVFSAVNRWMKNTASDDIAKSATHYVGDQARGMIRKQA